ncbi:MAG: DUF4388 domain-containing protein [Desulfobacterales bacterium]|nr:DUF4388 domain-containing protein [Desulfobacterales bacterium]
MPLKGTIDTISLASILQLLCNEKKTGILKINNIDTNNESIEYQFFYYEGAIIFAIQSKKEARLGVLLKNKGIVTDVQLNEALDIAKEKKQSLGKSLIEKGYITFEILERFLFQQVEEIIFNLFQWKDGDFEYFDTKLNLRWLELVKLNTLKLIMDASRRIDELNRPRN